MCNLTLTCVLLIACKNLRWEKINKRGRGWPIFKKNVPGAYREESTQHGLLGWVYYNRNCNKSNIGRIGKLCNPNLNNSLSNLTSSFPFKPRGNGVIPLTCCTGFDSHRWDTFANGAPVAKVSCNIHQVFFSLSAYGGRKMDPDTIIRAI